MFLVSNKSGCTKHVDEAFLIKPWMPRVVSRKKSQACLKLADYHKLHIK